MANNSQAWPVLESDDVVLVTYADCEAGYRRARELLTTGCRVVVTARQVTALTRILLGQRCSQVMAVAADIEDPAQRAQLAQRVQASLGHLTWVLDGRSGELTALSDNTGQCTGPPRRAGTPGADDLMLVAQRRRSNATRMVARVACDSKATDTSHISSLASS